jgi:hypothetical protein
MLSTFSVLPEDCGMSVGGYEQYDERIQAETLHLSTFGKGLWHYTWIRSPSTGNMYI